MDAILDSRGILEKGWANLHWDQKIGIKNLSSYLNSLAGSQRRCMFFDIFGTTSWHHHRSVSYFYAVIDWAPPAIQRWANYNSPFWLPLEMHWDPVRSNPCCPSGNNNIWCDHDVVGNRNIAKDMRVTAHRTFCPTNIFAPTDAPWRTIQRLPMDTFFLFLTSASGEYEVNEQIPKKRKNII